jgi:hypothetical protein
MMSLRTRTSSIGFVLAVASFTAQALPAVVVTQRSGVTGFQERLGNGDTERVANTLATDAQGNTYLVGSRWNGTDWDWRTTKYGPEGSERWSVLHAAPGTSYDYPYAVAADANGNVYVAGDANLNFTTIKYDANGVKQWKSEYNGPSFFYDQPRAMVLDAAGNVYVTGRSMAGGFALDNYDYATVKYDNNGVQKWVARYDGPGGKHDEATALAVDGAGNVYVTGTSKSAAGDYDYATVKYDAAGVQQWVTRYNGPVNGEDDANALVLDGATVIVTGQSDGGSTSYDAATVKYDAASGAQIWASRYDGSGHHNDVGKVIAKDGSGNLYIAGYGWDPGNGFLVLKYDSSGVQQWSRNYFPVGSAGANFAHAIAVDAAGSVFVAGQVYRYPSPPGRTDYDFDLAKYDTDGNLLWHQAYDGVGGNTDDEGGTLALRNDGVIAFAGIEAYDQNGGGGDRRTLLFIADGAQATNPQISIGPSVTGQAYTVNVSVRGKVGLPPGTLDIHDDEGHQCSLANFVGDGLCTLQNTSAGAKAVTATYTSSNTPQFLSSSAGVTHTVSPAATALTVSTSGHSHPGESVTATIALSVTAPGVGTLNGTVSVSDGVDSCAIALPASSCDVALTTPGLRTLTATYAGDANFSSSSATFVHRVNRTPVVANDVFAAKEDTSLTLNAANGVLGNDSDADADGLSVVNPATFTAGGIGGTVVLRANGSLDYTPPADANGTATFDYVVSDGTDTASASATIQVQALNDPPGFSLQGNLNHAAGTSGAQNVPGFVGNFSSGPADESNQAVTTVLLNLVSDPHGVLVNASLAANGTLSYNLSGRGGTATLQARVRDDGGTADGGVDTSAPQTFQITVASGVDLNVSVDNGGHFINGGSHVDYSVIVGNAGPDAAVQALVSIPVPQNLSDFAWTCVDAASAPCSTGQGTGAVSMLVDIPVNASITFHLGAIAAATPEQDVVLTATVTAQGAQTELQAGNNSASDSDPVGIFADDFE